MIGVIDVGSNTIRLSFYNAKDGRLTLGFSKKVTAGLFNYVEGGALSLKGTQKLCRILEQFAHIAAISNLDAFFVFASSFFRSLSNHQKILDAVKTHTGLQMEILTHKDEAQHAFVGAMAATKISEGLLIDLGGSHTDIIHIEEREAKQTFSIPVGSLSLFRRFVRGIFPEPAEAHAMREYIHECVARLSVPIPPKGLTICGIGGTFRAARAMERELLEASFAEPSMPVSALSKMLDLLPVSDPATRIKIIQASPERLHTFLPGLIALDVFCSHFGASEIIVSPFGVREGYAISRLKADA